MKNNNTSTKLVLAIVKAKSGIATGGKYYSVIRNYINKNIFFFVFLGRFYYFFLLCQRFVAEVDVLFLQDLPPLS